MNNRTIEEISEHDQLVLMMAQHFNKLGYTNIKADITGWTKPDFIFWLSNKEKKFFPDLTCRDDNGKFIILEAETCSTLNIDHTKEQFEIFRAHASKQNGRFDVVVPKLCSGNDGRQQIIDYSNKWGIEIDKIWTPS